MKKQRFSLLVLLLIFAGYPFPTLAQDEDPLLASIRKTGQFKVALASVPPYVMMSPNGEATGVWVDLDNMVLKRMGLPALTPVFVAWNAMSPGLQAHQFDAIGVQQLNEAVCKVAAPTTPIYATKLGLFVQRGNPKHLTSVAAVAHRPEIRLAVIPGSSQERFALQQGVKPGQLLKVPDVQAAVATVTGGRTDSFLLGQFSLLNPQQKGLDVVVDEQAGVYVNSLDFRKEDIRFRDAFNEQLNFLIRNGTIQKLYEKYGIPDGDVEAKLLARFTKASDVVPSCK